MNKDAVNLVIALLFAPVAKAQLAATPQLSPMQSQSVPCSGAPSNSQKQLGTIVSLKPPTKWQQYLDSQKKALEGKYGIVLPDAPTQIPLSQKTSTPPCVPQVASASAILKIPADVSLSIHCNPVVSPKGASPSAFPLFLPDPHAFAEPSPTNPWEAEDAVPDMKAKTPCYALKVNPKTNKFFIPQ